MPDDAQPMLFDIDLETFSDVDLKKTGAYKYAADPSTDVLCARWREWGADGPEGPMHLWRPGLPAPVIPAGSRWRGHNACEFDAVVWFQVLHQRYGWAWPGWDRFDDTLWQCCYANLPGKLGEVAKALGTHEKDAIGARLMLRLCKPAHKLISDADPRRLHTPERLDQLEAYCGEDVEAEQALVPHLPKLPGIEPRVARATAAMNRHGVLIDRDRVERLTTLAALCNEQLVADMVRVTRGRIESVSQLAKIREYCNELGFFIPDGKGCMDADAVDRYLVGIAERIAQAPGSADAERMELCRAVLWTRRTLGRSALAKLEAMRAVADGDNRLRGLLAYGGAHQTLRWAGRRVQYQNMPRGILMDAEYDTALTVLGRPVREAYETFDLCYNTEKDNLIPEVLTSLLRTCFVAPPGQHLLVCDYSAIEGRVLAWLAGEEPILQAYRDGKRLYCVAAAGIYGESYEAIERGRKHDARFKLMDQVGKVTDLACGYQGAKGAFQAMAANYGLRLPEAEVERAIKGWRDSHPKTVAFWYNCERAALDAVRNPGRVYDVGRVAFRFNGQHLHCRLPSGRLLWYRDARIRPKVMPWGDTRDALNFMGEDQGRYTLCDTYGGSIVENIAQAAARDLLAHGLLNVIDAGRVTPTMLVHDELVGECPVPDVDLLQVPMLALPAWAEGLPMKAAGFATSYYRK